MCFFVWFFVIQPFQGDRTNVRVENHRGGGGLCRNWAYDCKNRDLPGRRRKATQVTAKGAAKASPPAPTFASARRAAWATSSRVISAVRWPELGPDEPGRGPAGLEIGPGGPPMDLWGERGPDARQVCTSDSGRDGNRFFMIGTVPPGFGRGGPGDMGYCISPDGRHWLTADGPHGFGPAAGGPGDAGYWISPDDGRHWLTAGGPHPFPTAAGGPHFVKVIARPPSIAIRASRRRPISPGPMRRPPIGSVGP